MACVQGMAGHCWVSQNGLIFSCIFWWPIYASFAHGDSYEKLSSSLTYVNCSAVSCPIRWEWVLQSHQCWTWSFSCWITTLMLSEFSGLLMFLLYTVLPLPPPILSFPWLVGQVLFLVVFWSNLVGNQILPIFYLPQSEHLHDPLLRCTGSESDKHRWCNARIDCF